MPNDHVSAPSSSSLDFGGTWQRVQSLLLSTEDVDDFLIELAGLGAAVVDPAASCGITSRYDGHPITVASSDERAAALDETQYAGGAGPCLFALESGHAVIISDVRTDTRWPEFADHAQRVGLRSSLSIPLRVEEIPIGAMNFYSFDARAAFDLTHQTAAALFAAQAAGALQLLTRNARNVELVRDLERALGSRSVIDQALGVLMAQLGVPVDQAFDRLRERSQREQRRLREIAAEVVTVASGSPPADPSPFRR